MNHFLQGLSDRLYNFGAGISANHNPALQKARMRVLWIVMAFVIVAVGSVAARPWLRLGLNGSDSLPGLVYAVLPGQMPQRGELIAFYPPHNTHYPDGMYFVKVVKGVGGDRISRRGQTFFINGDEIASAKLVSRDGLPLVPGPTGVMPVGTFWAWTPHPDSYDSRYADVGWVVQSRVLGRAVRIL